MVADAVRNLPQVAIEPGVGLNRIHEKAVEKSRLQQRLQRLNYAHLHQRADVVIGAPEKLRTGTAQRRDDIIGARSLVLII